MSIREIREQLLKYKRLTLSELSTVLNEKEDNVSFILDEWIVKGKIKKEIEVPICSSGGCSCSSGINGSCSSVKYYYEWVM